MMLKHWLDREVQHNAKRRDSQHDYKQSGITAH